MKEKTNKMYLLTKVSNDNFYKITGQKDMEKIFKKYGQFIFQENYWYKESVSDITKHLTNGNVEDAKEISKIQYSIIIYDSYIE